MNFSKPKNFSFKNTIYSHGWSELSPFELNEEHWHLSYVFNENVIGRPILVKIFETDSKINIELSDKSISRNDREKIKQKVKHILRLDEDFSNFYKIIKENKEFSWIAKNNIGRLMRSPTVFEDLVKTICTTNCSWSLTKNMVTNLVKKLGSKTSDGKSAFPTAEAMANMDEKFYREEIRAGYRSPYLAELAEAIVTEKIKPEGWLESDLPTKELKKEMKKIKGVGDYAAENLLKLIGRYDGLALDSFLRSEFYKKHKDGNTCEDKEIREFYSKFDEFSGLAIWFDMTKRWFD